MTRRTETSANMNDPSDFQITVAAVGDFMLERRLATQDINSVREILSGFDLVVANVDTVLSDQGTPVPKWANLRGPREIAHDLRALGVDVVAMANNHTMDFRAAGLLDTCRIYNEVGMLHAGAGDCLAAATAPVVVEVGGARVAVLSIACTLPPESAAGPNWPGIAPVRVRYAFAVDETLLAEQPGTAPNVVTWLDEHDLERISRDVAAARAIAEVVLVVVHWGVPAPWRLPSQPTLQEYQRSLGRMLIDAGADAVLGNHAHELHGIEFHRNRPIAYCLGNFWIDTIAAYPWMGRESIALGLTLSRTSPPTVSILPVLLDDGGVPRADLENRAVKILDEQSGELGVIVEAVGGRFMVHQTTND